MRLRATVGIRFHSLTGISLLERCLLSVAAQTGVQTDVCIAVQNFDQGGLDLVARIAEKSLTISDSKSLEIVNVPNSGNKDIRSKLLNSIVDYHYRLNGSCFLSFIDYDDIWFSHALSTLIGSLASGRYALSHADIHVADTVWTDQAFIIKEIQDRFRISTKTKNDLRIGNFLPLHSYMFYTKDLRREILRYDETISRLEDYDVLLRIASSFPICSSCRSTLIGLYNFYTDCRQPVSLKGVNTMRNPFADNDNYCTSSEELETLALEHILKKYRGQQWRSFLGEAI